jgi:ribosomal protein S18 acetylase RimI-like enzyme
MAPGLVRLRSVASGDLPALTQMAIAFNEEDGHPLSRGGRAALKALCKGTPHGLGFMIERGPELIGYLAIGLGFSIEYGGIDAFLDEFYIEPAHRGRGLGTAALKAFDAIARKMKIKALHLEAMPQNDRAARLYRRLGHKLSERRLMSKRY